MVRSECVHELGAAMDVPDQDGFTPLFAAAQHEQKEIAQVLVELGADVNKALRDTKEKQHPAAYQILKEIYSTRIVFTVSPSCTSWNSFGWCNTKLTTIFY